MEIADLSNSTIPYAAEIGSQTTLCTIDVTKWEAAQASRLFITKSGRGERIRTSDLTVPNDRRGKNVSICLFKSCSHQGIPSVLHPFDFLTIRYRLCAANSVHKLATSFWGEPLH